MIKSSRVTVRAILDRIVFAAIALPLLAGLPRAMVFGSVINVQAWANVLLLSLLATYFIVRRQKSTFVIYMTSLFVCYSLVGYVATGDPGVVVSHAFLFAPFAIAVLLLELRVGYSFHRVLFSLTICAAVGAIAANVIHFFFPGTLELLLREEEDISGVISLGRVSWSGYVLSLPLIAQIGLLNIYSRRRRVVVLACLPIVLMGALLTFNRTLLVALLALGGYLLISMRRQIGLKGIAVIGTLSLAGSYFINWWSEINPALQNLIDYRILYFFAGSSETTGDVSTRVILYSEYFRRLTHSHFLGQGLGVPVSTYLGPSLWADMSLVNFALPFGMLGLVLLGGFVRKLYRRIVSRIRDPRVQKLFLTVLFLALVVSLNDDILSHKNFLIYFVYLINSYDPASSQASPGDNGAVLLSAHARAVTPRLMAP